MCGFIYIAVVQITKAQKGRRCGEGMTQVIIYAMLVVYITEPMG